MILVTTAGKVGAEAARPLALRAEPVRVLVRDPDKAKALAEAGAEVAVGDLDVPATVDAAMADVTAVILVSPAVPEQELNVVASAARAGVGHVVKATSKASADSPIARRRGQTEIEAGLAASGLPHTLLRSNAYMQNVLMLAPAIAATSGFGSAAGKGRAGMIDARDVAAVAAGIAAENKDAMNRAGVPAAIAEMNAQAFRLTASGDAEWVSDDVPSILGRPARSFRQFAADYAGAFS
ncbi:MAG: NmrA family NAD(P)-binding protein [Trebonia sp.]|jgi:uncharacterized protein YbjT (DUF2867 family)